MEIEDVRRANARFLASRVGGISKMAERLGKSQPQMSHLIGEKPIKGIGRLIARQINESFGKPAGWLDRVNEGLNYGILCGADWQSFTHEELGSQSAVTISPASELRSNDPAKQVELESNVLPGPNVRGNVPLISWVQAGNAAEVIDLLSPGEAYEWIPTTLQVNIHTYALRVQGDSMSPEFPPGTILIVEPDMDPEVGDYVIAKNGNDEATFKKLVKDGGVMYLKPLNLAYPMFPLDDFRVVGVVRGVTRTFR